MGQARRVGERIGIMGGTFDPIHNGHLVAASEAAHLYDLTEVVFVPTGEPWQKTSRAVTPAEDRYLMTVLATATNPMFSVSRIDIDRPGLTYTIDTLRELAAERPGGELFFITGADALAQDPGLALRARTLPPSPSSSASAGPATRSPSTSGFRPSG